MNRIYISIEEQTAELRKENAALKDKLEQSRADIEYIAMMTDVELDEGEENNYAQPEI